MAVNSPCIDVCRIDGKSGLCVGCFRTREEIRGWKTMTDHRRHQVINDRSRREAKVQRESQRTLNCIEDANGHPDDAG
ncbi:DUF1289 domain-containing protein [Paraburkholderia ultramafica]|uniref:DUF1289 domain-containing protein n=1 Tax=Paraburkholderia ultramafica TaxID=1544867 RepID=UPI001581B5A6|nr:DUF1289 domain-containing protein [Paraburkholderia ultramafica]